LEPVVEEPTQCLILVEGQECLILAEDQECLILVEDKKADHLKKELSQVALVIPVLALEVRKRIK